MAADVQVSMLPDLSENLSNEQTTWEEIMQIKALPIPMAQKKEMKAKILVKTCLIHSKNKLNLLVFRMSRICVYKDTNNLNGSDGKCGNKPNHVY